MADPLDRANKAPRLLTALTIIGVLMIAFASLSFNFDNSSAADTEDSIPISSPEDLARIGTGEEFGGHIWSLDAYYYLTNDIYLTGTNNHIPIGTSENPFTGTFDGRNHNISGINIVSGLAAALFGYISASEIKNLGLIEGTMTVTIDASGNYSVGGIVGHSVNSTISGCYNSCDVSAKSNSDFSAAVGGIVGFPEYTTITDCYNTGTITGLTSKYARAGGIAGKGSNTTISGCFNTGTISAAGENPHAGGIMAEGPNITILDCYNTGPIYADATSYARAGGIFAYNPENMLISNSYNIGPISSSGPSAYSSGIVTAAIGTVVNCYYLASQLYINGNQAADELYYSSQISVDGTGTDPPRLPIQGSSEAKQAYQMKAWLPDAIAGISIYYTGTTAYGSQSIPGWDFVDIWTINENINDGYPILISSLPAFETSSALIDTLTGMQIYYVPTLTDGASVTASELPEGLSWDGKALTGSVSSAGSYAITLLASWDYQGVTVTDTQKIEIVVASAPSFSSSYVEIETLVGHELIYTPMLDDGASVTASDLPDGLVWNGTVLSGKIATAGEYTVILTATWNIDGTDHNDEQKISIIVTSAGGGGGGEDGKDDDGKGVLDDIKGFLGSDIHMLYYLLIVICVIALAVSAYLRRPVLSVMALSALIILVLNEYMGWF